ncbi:hypothetical protein KQI52_02605 [bacterium]|nr:hypothetical protein [bacterium]
MDFNEANEILQNFSGEKLSSTISRIENELMETDVYNIYNKYNINDDLVKVAIKVKELSSKINIILHSVAILKCLPLILKQDEVIENISLGAGNTGKEFDLETNRRVAEFKFIFWRGGSESIRQNSIFKDFFGLAEDESNKEKYLYVLSTDHVVKFLESNRSMNSILSRNVGLKSKFETIYGDKIMYIREYYEIKKNIVKIKDVSKIVFDEPLRLR